MSICRRSDIELNSQLAKASWCQRKRWHHLPYL